MFPKRLSLPPSNMPWQSLPPLIIVCLGVAGIGALPYGLHKLAYGKKREVGWDDWDHKMQQRDTRLEERAKQG